MIFNSLNSLTFLLLFTISIFPQTHPRLFYGPSDVATLKSRATTPGTPAYEIWQLIKERQSDWYRVDTRQSFIAGEPWQMENLFSVALGYIITNDISYREAVRNIVLEGGLIDPEDALVNVESFAYKDPYIEWSEEFYRTARIITLSIVADVLWDSFTEEERLEIRYKVVEEINNGLNIILTGQDFELRSQP
jgi:hypothetical protein